MLEGKDILIVEDDPVFRNMVASFLRGQGCDVVEAENGIEGLKALREAIPDLVLSDLVMPEMDGLRFVEEVSLEFPMVPVVVISGTGGMKDVATALRLGVKDYLVKPLNNIGELKSAIESVLRDSDDDVHSDSDFTRQWFNVESEEQPLTEELKWHLDDLLDNPGNARDLLMGLMPDTDTRQGDWSMSYHHLQSMENNPVVLDYTWLMDGRLAFYLVDSHSAGENGPATTLMVRAFFNEYLRSVDSTETDLKALVTQIENSIKHTGYASPIRAIFGIFNAVTCELQTWPAGFETRARDSSHVELVKSEQILGVNASSQKMYQIHAVSEGQVHMSLSETGTTNFSIDIHRKA
ncbi:response regulator [Parasalinivibrio latis]|uniref:response regulator n=1 Tax=Parasalinivibrio latis TaxID=2952610 RepID=UPI0030E55974